MLKASLSPSSRLRDFELISLALSDWTHLPLVSSSKPNAAVSSRERANASRGLLDCEVRRQRRDCQRRGCRRPWMTPSTTISSDIAWK
jgi:hypothetical protein